MQDAFIYKIRADDIRAIFRAEMMPNGEKFSFSFQYEECARARHAISLPRDASAAPPRRRFPEG